MTESSFSKNTAAAKKLFGTAAKLAQKQAELMTLNKVTPPRLYHAIGQRIIDSPELPPALVPHRERIREDEAGTGAKPGESKPENDVYGGIKPANLEKGYWIARKTSP